MNNKSEEKKNEEDDFKYVNKCHHGDNAKCPNCLDKDKIKDIKHIAFDEYILQHKNAIFPQQNRYKLDITCKNHAP